MRKRFEGISVVNELIFTEAIKKIQHPIDNRNCEDCERVLTKAEVMLPQKGFTVFIDCMDCNESYFDMMKYFTIEWMGGGDLHNIKK